MLIYQILIIDKTFQDKVVVKGINDRSAIYNLSERARNYLANEKTYREINFLEIKFNIHDFKFVN